MILQARPGCHELHGLSLALWRWLQLTGALARRPPQARPNRPRPVAEQALRCRHTYAVHHGHSTLTPRSRSRACKLSKVDPGAPEHCPETPKTGAEAFRRPVRKPETFRKPRKRFRGAEIGSEIGSETGSPETSPGFRNRIGDRRSEIGDEISGDQAMTLTESNNIFPCAVILEM